MDKVRLSVDMKERHSWVLSPHALYFLQALHERFAERSQALVQSRQDALEQIRQGHPLAPPQSTEWIRLANWKIPPPPYDLRQRNVEVRVLADEARALLMALKSGAQVCVAEIREANAIEAQVQLHEVAERRLNIMGNQNQVYGKGALTPTLTVRLRDWQAFERQLSFAGQEITASLFDFGLFFFHNARNLVAHGSGPLFELPQITGRRDAALWNEVFIFAQEYMGIARGSIRATICIENVLAAFEMDEILYELREHAVALKAGDFEYTFNEAYLKTLLSVCQRRGASAIYGAALETRQQILNARVQGFNGVALAHVELATVALEVFANPGAPFASLH